MSLIKKKILSSRFRPSLLKTYQILKSMMMDLQSNSAFLGPENTPDEIARKLLRLRGLGKYYLVNRVPLFREIARLEDRMGNGLLASVYKLRIMRLLGNDRFGDLPSVLASLEKSGHPSEARVAEALYGMHPDREARLSRILMDALHNNKTNPPGEFEVLDDRRAKASYKVSIIVSLYNAAGKLPLFLKTLQSQSLIKTGLAEIILIDSGSPDRENKVFNEMFPSLAPHIVYARSTHRETIQAAWNRRG